MYYFNLTIRSLSLNLKSTTDYENFYGRKNYAENFA